MRIFCIPAVLCSLLSTPIYASECIALWLERNEFWNSAGQCFSSKLGSEIFDNSDCTAKSPSLTAGVVKKVNQIVERERELNCSSEKSSWTVEKIEEVKTDVNGRVEFAESDSEPADTVYAAGTRPIFLEGVYQDLPWFLKNMGSVQDVLSMAQREGYTDIRIKFRGTLVKNRLEDSSFTSRDIYEDSKENIRHFQDGLRTPNLFFSEIKFWFEKPSTKEKLRYHFLSDGILYQASYSTKEVFTEGVVEKKLRQKYGVPTTNKDSRNFRFRWSGCPEIADRRDNNRSCAYISAGMDSKGFTSGFGRAGYETPFKNLAREEKEKTIRAYRKSLPENTKEPKL